MTARSFVLKHTRLQSLAGFDGLRLHLSDEVLGLWRAVQEETGDDDAQIPYWAFAWGGGLAIARFLDEHPERVSGLRVLDIASGSGLCAIAAIRAGAAEVTAADIDGFAAAAIELNARANCIRINVVHADLLEREPPDVDLILAGDCWYEETFGHRTTAWLQLARSRGIDVLIGDPHRRYLERDAFREVASYEVRSTTDLEDLGRTTAFVAELR